MNLEFDTQEKFNYQEFVENATNGAKHIMTRVINDKKADLYTL